MVMRNLIVVLMLSLMCACAGTKHAYQAADGIEETAKVMSEHFFALVREANALAESGELAGSDLARAQNGVSRTRPVVRSLAEASQAYEAVQNSDTEAELNRAINDAAIAISRLINTLKQARATSQLFESLDLKVMYVAEVTS